MSRSPFRSCTIFEGYQINSLRFSEVYFFHILHPTLGYFFVAKGNLNCSDSNM